MIQIWKPQEIALIFLLVIAIFFLAGVDDGMGKKQDEATTADRARIMAQITGVRDQRR